MLERYSSLLAVAATVGVLAWHSRSKNRKRFCTNILAELEILIESQSACLMIIPDIHVRLSLPQLSYCSLPMIYIVNSLSMGSTSSREPHETGMKVCYCLRKIFPQSILPSHKGVSWEERYKINGNCAFLQRLYDERCVPC